MARARDQFAGHTWLSSLAVDKGHGNSSVYEVEPVETNMQWLNARDLLILCRKTELGYTVHCFPRRDVKGPAQWLPAAAYEGCSLPSCLQAAVNDYTQILARTSDWRGGDASFRRRPLHVIGGDPCLQVR